MPDPTPTGPGAERERCARIVAEAARRQQWDADGQPPGGYRDLRIYAARVLREVAERIRGANRGD